MADRLDQIILQDLYLKNEPPSRRLLKLDTGPSIEMAAVVSANCDINPAEFCSKFQKSKLMIK